MLQLLPADNDQETFYKNTDVLFLSSREDPYPLVVLEAAAFAKPAICFKDAGGAPEFVLQDAGIIVPYLDILAVANALLLYQQTPALVREHGVVAKARLQELHQHKAFILKQFDDLVN